VSGVRGLSSGGALLGGAVGEAWWLVVEHEDGARQVVAGPFPDRAEAAWATATAEHARPLYGVRRPDGSLKRRPSPQDWTWLAHLQQQIDRVPEGWDAGLSEEDPLVTLLVEITAALAEAGLPLHESTGAGAALGGACLTPEPALGGIVVGWRQHDRMSVDHAHGAAAHDAVQQVMNQAVADVLELRGFDVEAFGTGSGYVVRPAA
jgi:hypothetical protein